MGKLIVLVRTMIWVGWGQLSRGQRGARERGVAYCLIARVPQGLQYALHPRCGELQEASGTPLSPVQATRLIPGAAMANYLARDGYYLQHGTKEACRYVSRLIGNSWIILNRRWEATLAIPGDARNKGRTSIVCWTD